MDARRAAAPDDPPHDQGASRQGNAPAPAGHQGAEPVLHRRRREVPRYTTDGTADEGQVRRHVRGGVPAAGEASRTTRRSSRKWICESDAAEVHNGYFSIDKKGAWTDTAESNQASRDNAERAYSLIMRDKEKLLSFETQAEVHLLPLRLARGLGQPERLPDLRPARDRHGARAPPDDRARAAALRQPAGRARCAASRSTRSPSSRPRATSSSPRTSRRRSSRTPASASASSKSTSSPPSR